MAKAKAEKKPENFVAVIFIQGGGGTWARGITAVDAAKACTRLTRQDWKSLFDIPKDHVFKVNVWDVEGIEHWRFDERGMFEVLDEETEEERPLPKERHSLIETT